MKLNKNFIIVLLCVVMVGCQETTMDNPDKPLIIHHARSGGDSILTRIVRDGTISLDPPGLELPLADIYGGERGL